MYLVYLELKTIQVMYCVQGHLWPEKRPWPEGVLRHMEVTRPGQEGLILPVFVWLRPERVKHCHGGVQEEGRQPGQDEGGVAVRMDIMFIS